MLEIKNTFAGGEFRKNVTKSRSSRRRGSLEEKLCGLLGCVKAEQGLNK
jgi:hypothetical protein